MSNSAPLLALELRELAEQAVERSGMLVEDATSVSQLSDASEVFRALWGGTSHERYASTDLLKALVHSGGHVGVAYSAAARDVVAASLAFVGKEGEHVFLHSDLLGVMDGYRNCGIGYAIKLHQAAWAAEKNYLEIRWTYDPLISRNAYFNFCKLGVEWMQFLPGFYADRKEGDRFLVKWRPADNVNKLAEGKHTHPSPGEFECIENEVVQLPISTLIRDDAHQVFLQLTQQGFQLAGVNETLEYVWVRKNS